MSGATIHGPADVLRHFGLEGERWPSLNRAFYKGTACGGWIETVGWDRLLVGSIVEGHVADVPTRELRYPFPASDLDDAIKGIESDAHEMWHEANCHADDCPELDCPGCLEDCGCY